MSSSQARLRQTLDQLQQLSDHPDAQFAFALRLIERERLLQLVLPALKVVQAAPQPAVRPLLLSRYAFFHSDWSKRDQGANIRTALLTTLRPIATLEDRPLLEQALTTYEFLPPSRSESASSLRAAALLTLAQLDDRRASFWAVKLLADEHTARMSGEPALTAARTLAAQGHLLPLYSYAVHGPRQLPEVLIECFKSLTSLPITLVNTIIGAHQATTDDVTLVGLLDLALAHDDWQDLRPFLNGFLRTTKNQEVYRYVVMSVVAGRNREQIEMLAEVARLERDPGKLASLISALSLARGDTELERLVETLKRRVQQS
jgi:hypothetical protein